MTLKGVIAKNAVVLTLSYPGCPLGQQQTKAGIRTGWYPDMEPVGIGQRWPDVPTSKNQSVL